MLDINTYKQRVLVSQKFIDTVTLTARRQRKTLKSIAADYGYTASFFSQVLNHYSTITKSDPEFLRLISDLGLNPEDCFDD